MILFLILNVNEGIVNFYDCYLKVAFY
jgi:hypothetical protein